MKTEQKTPTIDPKADDWLADADWPNTVRTRTELDAALEAARASGPSPLSPAEVIAAIKAKHASRG